MSFSLTLALRFLKSKRFGPLARFISMASTLGICTGVCALIIGLSAMNGFEYELHNRVLSLVPGGEIKTNNYEGFRDLKSVIDTVASTPGVEAVSPVIEINGAFSLGTSFSPALILGIDTLQEKRVIAIDRFMDCHAEILNTEDNLVILGYAIAKKLHVKKGDSVNLSVISTQMSNDGLSRMTMHPLKVAGFFKTGGNLDGNFAFISLNQALKLSQLKNANAVHIKVKDMLAADAIVSRADSELDENTESSSWLRSQGKLYNDINMIRGIMYIAMILVIAVACFNIVSNLMMAVSEKRHEIAILLTMGANRSLIRKAFTLMGILSALKGAGSGVLAGCIIASVTPYVTSHFKAWFGFDLLNENIYFINYVPSVLDVTDVLIVISCALLMGALASIYPAHKAAKINPANELNL